MKSDFNHATTDMDFNIHDIPYLDKTAVRRDMYHILLVDDSEDSVQYVKSVLKPLPYRIDTAENGAIGVGMFQEDYYHLVLMDIQMPVMGGYTATQLIREWERNNNLLMTPIIAISASVFEGDKEHSIEAGCNEHLRKPLDKKTLQYVIRKHIYLSMLQAFNHNK
jgi:CheY-like chemotaxis protein